MPTSNKKRTRWVPFYIVVFLSACFIVWFNQDSIEIYWQQQYHRGSPLRQLKNNGWWRKGAMWREKLRGNNNVAAEAENKEKIEPVSEVIITKPLPVQAENEVVDVIEQGDVESELTTEIKESVVVVEEVEDEKGDNQNVALVEEISTETDKNIMQTEKLPDKVILTAGDNVLFVGDSMMQSFAPHMQRWLKNNYDINSLNMGRHSTGLTNQIYFDWAKKAENSFSEYEQLKLVVVMLGANDPWNIETAQRSILNFKTPEWDAEYSNRIMRIVAAAREQNAQVIWIGLPYMRIKKYNKKVIYIDDLLRDTLDGEAIYIPIRHLLSEGDSSYQDSINIDGEWVRLRHKDGIHLNARAELLVLNAIKPYLDLKEASDN